jgi:hypothetical protein
VAALLAVCAAPFPINRRVEAAWSQPTATGRTETYERNEWGNNASPVTAEQISALRKELASHLESFVEHEIPAVPDEDLLGGPASAGGAPPKPGEAAKPAPPPKP